VAANEVGVPVMDAASHVLAAKQHRLYCLFHR
jgi:hypothetical protein